MDKPDEFLEKVWAILVKHAGAHDDPDAKVAFVSIARDYVTSGRCLEYRFMGGLGFGGKVWLNNNPKPYVNCYPEDMNKERGEAIDTTNRELAKL